MKTILRGAAALAALAAFSGVHGTAKAADVTYSEPVYSWSGIYVGGYVGAGATVARAEADAEIPQVFSFDADFKGIGGEGLLAGGLIGYNWQVSEQFVLGVQGDLGWTDLEAKLELGDAEAKAGPDFIANASLRAGYLVTPETLFYLIGGYSYAEYKLDLDGGDDFDQDYDGFHVGTGMETRLTDRLTARIEYRYTKFGGEDWDTDGFLEITPSVHTGTLGIAYNLFPTAGDGQIATPVADIVEPQVSWTGFYVGANGGAGAVVNRITGDDVDAEFDGVGGEGILGSLMAGYNWQASERFVLGIQGDIGIADIKSELDASLAAGPLGFGLNADAKLDWFASASVRAGYLPSPDTMIYVIGGYSYAHYKLDGELSVTLDGGEGGEDFSDSAKFGASQDYNGYHVGTGIESMLTDNLTARVEYRFTQYGKEDWGIDGLEVAPSSHTGTIGIAWLFNDL